MASWVLRLIEAVSAANYNSQQTNLIFNNKMQKIATIASSRKHKTYICTKSTPVWFQSKFKDRKYFSRERSIILEFLKKYQHLAILGCFWELLIDKNEMQSQIKSD